MKRLLSTFTVLALVALLGTPALGQSLGGGTVSIPAGISSFADDTTPQLGGPLDTNDQAINFSEGTAVASATTTDIWVTDGNVVHVTGTVTIASFGTAPRIGASRMVIFDDVLTLIDGANLNLPGGVNINTGADDFAWVYAETTTLFKVVYARNDGTAIVGNAAFVVESVPDIAATATGLDAIAIGDGASATGEDSVAFGLGADASDFGQFSRANGFFAINGDAQSSIYILRNTTTDAIDTELFSNGSSTTISVPTDGIVFFTISIVARRIDADNEGASYRIEGAIDNNAGTTALIGIITKKIFAEDSPLFDVTVTADDVNDSINVIVTGQAGKTIRWVAMAMILEVNG